MSIFLSFSINLLPMTPLSVSDFTLALLLALGLASLLIGCTLFRRRGATGDNRDCE
jgi:hypothetical protein